MNSNKSQKDNFSSQADLYVKYRPLYPVELYEYLFSKTTHFDVAWDCGTGNGQVAHQLARRFKKVTATDISEKQLAKAQTAENIEYLLAPAGQTSISTGTVDLVTVAQAIHWFDQKSFYKEVQRVGKPGATLSYWGYNLLRVNNEIDPLINDFHDNVVGPYWDPERNILLNEYVDIHFPLLNMQHKHFTCRVQWNLDHLIGYLNSWSAVQHYIRQHHENPVEKLKKELKNKGFDNQYVNFPVFLILGYIS